MKTLTVYELKELNFLITRDENEKKDVVLTSARMIKEDFLKLMHRTIILANRLSTCDEYLETHQNKKELKEKLIEISEHLSKFLKNEGWQR